MQNEITEARPTIERLRETFHYDPIVGILMWKINKFCNGHLVKRIGDLAKKKNTEGYLLIYVDGRRQRAHRVIWAIVHGEWPPLFIDHINGVRTDNRIANLRLATTAQNNCNRPKASNNTSGYKGVTFVKDAGRFHAKIMVNGKQHYLGYHLTAEDASKAYQRAAKALHGDFTRDDGASHVG